MLAPELAVARGDRLAEVRAERIRADPVVPADRANSEDLVDPAVGPADLMEAPEVPAALVEGSEDLAVPEEALVAGEVRADLRLRDTRY